MRPVLYTVLYGYGVLIKDWTAAPGSSAVDVQEIHSRIEALLQSYGLK